MHFRRDFIVPNYRWLFVLFLLRLLFLTQTFTDRTCFRFLMEQICYVPPAVVHHHRVMFFPAGAAFMAKLNRRPRK